MDFFIFVKFFRKVRVLLITCNYLPSLREVGELHHIIVEIDLLLNNLCILCVLWKVSLSCSLAVFRSS